MDGDNVQLLTGFISSVGFPIAVSIFALVKMDKTMQTINKSIENNNTLLSLIMNTLDIKPPKTGGE